MYGLRRNAKVPKLLSKVNGKQHATQIDHHDLLPTPPASNSTRNSTSRIKMDEDEDEEDIYADPLSDDDVEQVKQFQYPVRLPAESLHDTTLGLKSPPQQDGTEDQEYVASFQRPKVATPQSTGSKRSNASEGPSSDSDSAIFSSQGSSKRPKLSYSRNIFASQKPTSKLKQYSDKAKRQREEEKKARLRPPKTSLDNQPSSPELAKLRMPTRSSDICEAGKEHAAPAFKSPRKPEHTTTFADQEGSHSLSPSLSPLSSAPSSLGVEEIRALALPTPKPYVAKTECAVCGDEVELFLRQDFEDEYNKGERLNYKWQQRFCRYHKQHRAKLLWDERGYPEIDWVNFIRRLSSRKYHRRLKQIIAGEEHSMYRDQLAQRLKGKSKTAMQTLMNDEGRRSTSVGYYGPRGEKLMNEHIINYFSDQLRDRASKDRVIAAAGVSGGVSGFVQAVLVPELAVSLVMEDLGSGSFRDPIQVIAESAELGELLHPEGEDQVRELVAEDEVE